MDKLIGIGEAARYLNVCEDTLRKWDKAGKFPVVLTVGGHRRYRLSDIRKLQGDVEVAWKIRCLNSETKEFFDREFILDWSLIKDWEQDALFKAIESFVFGDIIRFRNRFKEITKEELLERLNMASEWHMLSVPGYFEDENYNGMGKDGLLRILVPKQDNL